MTLLYRVFSFAAALMIIVIGGSWLASKYDVGPDIGWWNQSDWVRYDQRFAKNDGVPVIGSGEVSFSVETFGSRSLPWETFNSSSQVLPVRYGRKGFFGFTQFGFGSNGAQSSGGNCAENVVNLLIIGPENPNGNPVFSTRVLLPRYFYFSADDSESVVALVVRKDTNNDGKLDCGDEAYLEAISLRDGANRRSEHAFIPDNITNVRYVDTKDAFTFSEVTGQGESLTIKTIEIASKDFEVTETVAPDLLSKAQAAFDNTSGD